LLDSFGYLDWLTELGFLLNACRGGGKRAAAARQAFWFMLLSWLGALLSPVA
jgi:hypothetical protein